MPLEISPAPGFLAVLVPPGNLAAEIVDLRRRILGARNGASALPFPAAAPLAWLPVPPDIRVLEALAAGAPRIYDRYRVEEGILFLGPGESAGPEDSDESGRDADGVNGSIPLPAGSGFPLARLSPEGETAADPDGLPAPPRIAFRTFQAVLLRLSWGDPRLSAMTWEPMAAARYPFRRGTRT